MWKCPHKKEVFYCLLHMLFRISCVLKMFTYDANFQTSWNKADCFILISLIYCLSTFWLKGSYDAWRFLEESFPIIGPLCKVLCMHPEISDPAISPHGYLYAEVRALNPQPFSWENVALFTPFEHQQNFIFMNEHDIFNWDHQKEFQLCTHGHGHAQKCPF